MTILSGQQGGPVNRFALTPARLMCLLLASQFQLGNALAQESAITPAIDASSKIAATIDNVTIHVADVERELSRTINDVKLNPLQRTAAQSATLEKMINQVVVLSFLAQRGLSAEAVEVELQIDELKAELETVEKTIDDYCKRSNLTLDDLRRQIGWQISWKRYLNQKLSDSFLENYFISHKRRFDDTELRVAHLLLKRPDNATTEQMAALTQTAGAIAEELGSTSLSFERAVKTHSDAPTKNSSGEIGWIGIDGPMPDAFTSAAFELSLAEVSPPVTTKFGVHLIMCMEVKEGTITWQDAMADVKKSASLDLFHEIATSHRPNVKIVYGDEIKN